MTVTVSIYCEDISTKLLTYDSFRLYRDTSPNGAFSTLVSTTTLVAAQTEYEVTDAAGTSDSFYRFAYYSTVSLILSDLSNVMQPGALTMRRLRLEAAREGGCAFAGTCSALGTTLLLKDDALLDSGVDAHFLEGSWIYRPDAAAAGDKLRRVAVSGFVTTAPVGLIPNRAWTNVPASGEVYQVFNLAPPIDWPGQAFSWDRAIRTALTNLWFIDQISLGVGTTLGKVRFDLSPYAAYVRRNDVRRVWYRSTDSNGIITDVDVDRNGRYWEPVENGDFGLSIDVYPAPLTTETVILEVNRTYEELYIDTDVTTGPLALAKAAVLFRFFESMNQLKDQTYGGELSLWKAAFAREYGKVKPTDIVRGI